MKNKFIIWLSCLLVLLSCKNEAGEIESKVIGRHELNRELTNQQLLNKVGSEAIYLELFEDNTFKLISNDNKCIESIKGTWYVDYDMESYFYVFEFNGKKIKTIGLFINIECESVNGQLIFNEQTINRYYE